MDRMIKKAYPLERLFYQNISKIRGYAYETVYTRKGLLYRKLWNLVLIRTASQNKKTGGQFLKYKFFTQSEVKYQIVENWIQKENILNEKEWMKEVRQNLENEETFKEMNLSF